MPTTARPLVDDYDYVVVLNPDAGKTEGGFFSPSSSQPYFVYMGNFGPWRSWEDTDGDGIPEILDPHPYGR